MADRLDALTVRESGERSFWTKIGVAWPNKNGAGYIVRLDAMPAPVEGQFVIHLREPLPKDGQARQRPQDSQGDLPAAHDLNDDVPF